MSGPRERLTNIVDAFLFTAVSTTIEVATAVAPGTVQEISEEMAKQADEALAENVRKAPQEATLYSRRN